LNPGGDYVWIIVCLVAWLYVVSARVVWFCCGVGCLEQHAPFCGRLLVVLSCLVVRWLLAAGVVLFENCIVDASIFFILCNFCRVIFLF
ncbi:hypothetical protein ACT3SZ_16335, partial [Corynebacterium sp. AOP40-9SA-29]|uniref:hypothetical protein n=1 Tax=Corynebacterium sp. AOP40-9SA-29 TaxID=3457677 RepID=UPI0040337F20